MRYFVAGLSALALLGILFWASSRRSQPTSAAERVSAAEIETPEPEPERRGELASPDDGAREAPAVQGDAPSDAGPTTLDGPAFQARLDSVAATFLGPRPDVAGLVEALRELAPAASVLEPTLERPTRGGIVRGRLAFRGWKGEAGFEREGDRLELVLDEDSYDAFEPPWIGRRILVHADPRGLELTVLFLPNLERRAADHVPGGVPITAGWKVRVDADGARGRETTFGAAPDGRGWVRGEEGGRSLEEPQIDPAPLCAELLEALPR